MINARKYIEKYEKLYEKKLDGKTLSENEQVVLDTITDLIYWQGKKSMISGFFYAVETFFEMENIK